MSLFHHVGIGTLDYQASVEFYSKTLEMLYPKEIHCVEGEYAPMIKGDQVLFTGVRFNNIIRSGCGSCLSITDLKYGIQNEFTGKITNKEVGSSRGCHISFTAPSEEAVNKWYEKCIELGATCNGKPGKREHYGNYYGAFVIDKDGYRIEACVKDYVKDNNIVHPFQNKRFSLSQ
jgi:catechol 2,3-dioxygenase-like lactoylglutathione lyase family enzyme